MKNKKTIVGVVLLIAILLVGVGYAVISNITLNISGNTTASPSQSNFTVEFSGTPETTKSVDSANVTAEINSTNKLKATIDVSGLTAKDDYVTATYTIENKSADLSADLEQTTTISNKEYFEVTSVLADDSIAAGGKTTIKVTVKLIKTPVSDDVSSTVNVDIIASPVQP